MENELGGSPPDLSGILSKVMSNPQAMGMLSSLLGNMQGEKQEKHEAEKHEAEKHGEAREERILPPKPKPSSQSENRKQLLLALKPFLSPERRQALDRILMISEALSLLQNEKRF